MQKNKLLLIPFLVGLLLIVYSWYLSYPLSHHSSYDSIFNNVSILYWIGFTLSLTSIYLIAINFKNRYLKWIMTVAFIIALYSLFYFYNTLSTSDATYFSGLTENFFKTHDLTPDFNNYYQWPAFFILADVTSTVGGLELFEFEFLLITILGFLLSTSLYVYFSHIDNGKGFLAVLAFFILSFAFLNYQAAPFTVAFCLLFLLFDLEIQKSSTNVEIAKLILFVAMTLLHFFAPLFFLAYLLIKLVISRSKKVFVLFIALLQIYLLVQITIGQYSFVYHIVQAFIFESDISRVAAVTIAAVTDQIDIIAQLFSRIVTISFGMICLTGFVFALTKKKLRKIDKEIFLMGIVYFGIGVVLYTLGTRAIPITFVPISIGIIYVFKSRFRLLFKYLLALLIVLTVFIPMHNQYSGYPITYQTKENLTTAKFLIEKYDWNSNRLVISDSGMKWYISPQVQVGTIDSNYEPRFSLENITRYDCIIYSIGLERSLQMNNISIEATSQQISDKYNIVYNSAFSYVAMKSR